MACTPFTTPRSKTARPELGHDHLADDAPGLEIGEPTLKPVTHFDPHLAVGAGDEQDGSVVQAFLTDLPTLGHPHGKLLQRRPLQGGHGENHDLSRVLLFKVLQQDVQLAHGPGRQHPRGVVHTPPQRGDLQSQGLRDQHR